MRVAVLANAHHSVERDIDFTGGVFTADGLGEMSVDDLRELDAEGQLQWLSQDIRILVLGYSLENSSAVVASGSRADTQLKLAVETEVVYVPPHRVGSKTEAELRRIVSDMVERGWILVEDSRIGAAGGYLTFERAEPLDAEVLASLLSYAG